MGIPYSRDDEEFDREQNWREKEREFWQREREKEAAGERDDER